MFQIFMKPALKIFISMLVAVPLSSLKETEVICHDHIFGNFRWHQYHLVDSNSFRITKDFRSADFSVLIILQNNVTSFYKITTSTLTM